MVTDLESRLVQALLDRLDPRLDEPCNVPGCTHSHAIHEVMSVAA